MLQSKLIYEIQYNPMAGTKVLNLEIFVAGIFKQIRPVWIGDLGTRPKNPKSLCLGPCLPHLSWEFCFSAVGDIVLKKCVSYIEKTLF
jgi:hypothetical protein